jgi:hypothetical protein
MEESEMIKKQLEQALSECARLREENARLRMLLNIQPDESVYSPDHDLSISQSTTPKQSAFNSDLSPEAKVNLFRGLFRGRDDVYALRWESRNGRSGYSPACNREWEQNDDGSYKLKKDIRNKEYFPSLMK